MTQESLPVRVRLSRRRHWRMPPNAVEVDRSTKWGNPWRVGQPGVPDAAEAVRRFRAAVMGFRANGSVCQPQANAESHIGTIIADAPRELRGKNRACWCKLGEPCHADVLLELANAPACEQVTA